MTPRFVRRSASSIPIPVSRIRRIRESGSASIEISYAALPACAGSWSERNLRLSKASAALEISSRKNTSLSLYRE